MRVQARWTALFLVLMALLVAGCQPVAPAPAADAGTAPAADESAATSAEPVVLTFSSQSVPDDAHTKAMEVFAEEVGKLTNGEVTVEIYPGGQLFTQDAELPAVVSGNLDMAYFDPNWFSQSIPFMSMFAAPYIFEDYDHMEATFGGELGQEIYERIAAEIGVRPLNAYYLGTRQVNLRDIGREVRTPEDMQGIKLRMPNSPTWLFMGEALGANPTPLNFTEVYLALQTGTIDGQDNPLPTDKNAKFYEVTKYIVLTGHYINPLFPTINEAKWQSLKPEHQQAILQAAETARQFVAETNLAAEAELLEFFEGEGLTIIEPDKQAFIDYARKMLFANSEMIGTWDMDLYEQIQGLAAE
jgi:TRAP-type transport system periplasmic protein